MEKVPVFDSTVEKIGGSWAFCSPTFWDFVGDLLGSGIFTRDSVSRAELDYSGPLKGKKKKRGGRMSLTAIEVRMQKSTLVEMVMPSGFAMVAVHAGHTEFLDRLIIQRWPWAKAMLWRLRYVCTQYTDTDTEPWESRTSHRALTAKVKGWWLPEAWAPGKEFRKLSRTSKYGNRE